MAKNLPLRRKSEEALTVATAHHEAGHAVVALHLGLGVCRVELTPDVLGQHGICHYYRWRVDLETLPIDRVRQVVEPRIISFLAGPVAEDVFLGNTPRGWQLPKADELNDPDDSYGDCVNAFDLAFRACESPDEVEAYLRWLSVRTVHVVRLLDKPIQRTAKALAKAGRLSGAEVKAILRSAK